MTSLTTSISVQDPAVADPRSTLAEAAAQLGVHYMTAYRYVRMGQLEAEQVHGQWRVSDDAVAALRSRREGDGRRRGRRPKDPGAAPKPRSRAGALAGRLVAGDQGGAWRLVESALGSGAQPDEVYLTLVGPALEIVGERWESGDISVADEHRASAVAMRVIGRLGALCTKPGRTRGTVVLAGAPGDRHAIPTAIMSDLIRARGFGVVDLGADVPAEELAVAASCEDRLVGVGVCATTPLDRARTRELRRAVSLTRARCGVPVLLGGAAVGSAGEAASHGADHWSDSAASAVAFFDAPGERGPGPRRSPS